MDNFLQSLISLLTDSIRLVFSRRNFKKYFGGVFDIDENDLDKIYSFLKRIKDKNDFIHKDRNYRIIEQKKSHI